MIIDEKLKTLHGKFSEKNARLLEYVENNPQMLERSNFKIMELNDNVFRLQPWPTFVGKSSKKTMETAGVGLFGLIKQIPGKVFANDPEKISQYYQLPTDEVKRSLRGLDKQLHYMVGRGDFIYSGSGWKCIEYNVTPNLGGWQSPLWEPLYLNHPLISNFIRSQNLKIENVSLIEQFFDFIIGVYKDHSLTQDGNREVNIAFQIAEKLFNLGEPLKIFLAQVYQKKLQAIDSGLKGKLIFCRKKDLEINNHCLYHQDTRINVLVWLDFQAIPGDIMEVFELGNVELCNGPMGDILSSKLNLALLSENQHTGVFSPQEEDLIKEHIPWSRRLIPGNVIYNGQTVDIEEFTISRQQQLVLKPAVGYGGEGISIGCNSSPEKWRQAVSTALEQKSWLVQEYVDTPSYFYQNGESGGVLHSTVWGFFILGSRYAGQWVRVLPDSNQNGIINCHQGAEVSVVFEI